MVKSIVPNPLSLPSHSIPNEKKYGSWPLWELVNQQLIASPFCVVRSVSNDLAFSWNTAIVLFSLEIHLATIRWFQSQTSLDKESLLDHPHLLVITLGTQFTSPQISSWEKSLRYLDLLIVFIIFLNIIPHHVIIESFESLYLIFDSTSPSRIWALLSFRLLKVLEDNGFLFLREILVMIGRMFSRRNLQTRLQINFVSFIYHRWREALDQQVDKAFPKIVCSCSLRFLLIKFLSLDRRKRLIFLKLFGILK